MLDMQRIGDCDADTMYMTLREIGINMKELDKKEPSVQYLRELYGFLLYAQLLAWKSGRSHRQIIRIVNQTLVESKPVQGPVKTTK
jgi:hypothetical protein